MPAPQENLKVQKIVAGVSMLLFLVKIAAWYITGSVAVLSDALESIVNVAAGLFGVYSLYLSAQPRDFDHPYGHGKIEFISAAIEGSLIFFAGLYIIYEGITGLIHPREVKELDWGLALLLFSALVNWVAGTMCLRIGKKNSSLALIASGKHLRSDVYTTLGIVLGLALMLFTGKVWIDNVVAILFALIILYTGFRIVRSSVAGIMDEADTDLLCSMVDTLNENRKPDWIDVHNTRIIKYGSLLHLDCHLTVPWYYNVIEAHQVVDELSNLVKSKYGTSMELFVHSDACMEFSCRICSMPNCAVRLHPQERKIQWTIKNISINTKHDVFTK